MTVADSYLDSLWVLVAAGLVFGMQGGFLCLESGLTRSKNAINVATKNLTDFSVSILLFWGFGFALMFGGSVGGWFGCSDFFPELTEPGFENSAFFLYQAMFCATATTIVSGAVAERTKFSAYLLITLIVSGFVYPAFGHWCWGGVLRNGQGWLADLGFVDFAGATVVHGVGAWAALGAVLIIGPRSGRFESDTGPRRIPGSNLPQAMLGTLLLWAGWIGFNGGSTLAMNNQVAGIVCNTFLAGASGMTTAVGAGWILRRYADVGLAINGSLAGLVAITAGCHAVSTPSAVVIGAMGAVFMLAAQAMLDRLRIDDAIGAVPVHGAAGAWGTVAVAVFGAPDALGTGLTFWSQLAVQILGVVVAFGVTFLTTSVLLWIIQLKMPLRVTLDQERAGLNITEHGESTELFMLLSALEIQQVTGSFRTVTADPYTDVGQIARQYNRVVDRVNSEIDRNKAKTRELESSRAQVKASQRRLQSILDSSLDPMIAVDESGRIQIASRSAETVFGWKPDELIGRPVRFLISDQSQADYDEHLAELGRSKEENQICELSARRADGDTFPCSWTTWTVSVPDQSISIQMSIVRDMTEQVATRQALQARERELQQAQKLDAIGSLAGGVAHEYNNLLQAIRGYAQFALSEIDGSSTAVADLEQVITTTDKAAQLTRQLLRFSRSDVINNLQCVNPNEVINELLELLRPLIGERISIDLSLDDSVVLVQSEATTLQQILMNLCINARDAMPDGGRIHISCRTHSMNEEACQFHSDLVPGRYVQIAVTDTGCGMTPEVQSRVFEPFFTTKQVGKGTGLGLAMVYGLVQQQNGSVYIYSEAGQGTSVRVYLPVCDEPAEDAVEEVEDVRGGTELILVAEDDPIVRKVAIRILERAGYSTLIATNGFEAVRVFEENRYRVSLALLDVVMPEMTGHEACDRMRSICPELPVVFCTGYDPTAQETGLLPVQSFVVVEKPFHPKVLLGAIRQALDLQHSATETVAVGG